MIVKRSRTVKRRPRPKIKGAGAAIAAAMRKVETSKRQMFKAEAIMKKRDQAFYKTSKSGGKGSPKYKTQLKNMITAEKRVGKARDQYHAAMTHLGEVRAKVAGKRYIGGKGRGYASYT